MYMDTHDKDLSLEKGWQMKYMSLSKVGVLKDHQCPVRDCPTFRPSEVVIEWAWQRPVAQNFVKIAPLTTTPPEAKNRPAHAFFTSD
jgi:hypothetical protein